MPDTTPPPPAYDSMLTINEDIVIGRRSGVKKGGWYLLRLGKKWPRLSLRTTDLRQAKAQAIRLYQAWLQDPDSDWRTAGGITSNHISFKKAAQEWLARQHTDVPNKDAVIRKFLLPFFDGDQDVKNMASVNDVMIEDYKLWRRSFWLTIASRIEKSAAIGKSIKIKAAHGAGRYEEPSGNTLNREYPVLRGILGYAHSRGYMGKSPLPRVKAESAKANPRPAFLGGDYLRVAAEAAKWIGEAKDEQTRMRRQLLSDWITVMRYSGIRAGGETEPMTWSRLNLDGMFQYRVPEDTKTGARIANLLPEAAVCLMNMFSRRVAYAEKHRQEFTRDDAVFVMENGESYGDLGNMFNQLVKRCNFPRHDDALFYSPYSLRHTYATFELAMGKDYAWLEEQMGTTTKMLKEHYTQGTIEQTRVYLRAIGILPPDPRAELSAQQMNDIMLPCEEARPQIGTIDDDGPIPPPNPRDDAVEYGEEYEDSYSSSAPLEMSKYTES